MKTQEEITRQIIALKEIRPKVRPRNMFGDDNLAQLDAQINVLENLMDNEDIYEKYDHSGVAEEILEAAIYARQWLDDEDDCESENLAEDWPLRE